MKKTNLQPNGLYLITCETCGIEALKKSAKARFCGPRCRYAFNYDFQRKMFPMEYKYFDGLLHNARIVLSLKGNPEKRYSKKELGMLQMDFEALPLPMPSKDGKMLFTFSCGLLVWDDALKYFIII